MIRETTISNYGGADLRVRPFLQVSNIGAHKTGNPDDGTPQDSNAISCDVSIAEDGAGGAHRDDEVGGPEEAVADVFRDDR